MPILSESNQTELREVLEKEMVDDVKVTFFTKKDSALIVAGRECITCKQTGELLHEVTALSDKLQLDVHEFYDEQDRAAELGIHRIPAFLLEGKAKGRVRFFGIPAGLEFPAFIDDLVGVSKGATTLSEGSREALGALEKDVHIQVFTTPM
jgi:alkyl hydroperoxide reductase subunit AhpF